MTVLFNCVDDELLGKNPQDDRSDRYSDNAPGYVNVSRSLDWTDHDKVLKCVTEHIALDQPKWTSIKLEVFCKFFFFLFQ